MATIFTRVPLFTEPSYQYSLALENQTRLLKFQWNTRSRSWHMDVRNEDQSIILLGQKIVPQFPMFVDYALQSFNMTGYFVLLPRNLNQTNQTNREMNDVPEKFALFYVFEQEE